LKVHLAGLPIEVGPDGRLSPGEKAVLERIESSPLLPGSAVRTLREAGAITLALEPPWIGSSGIARPGEPAEVTCAEDRVRIGAEGFRAILRPATGNAELFREPDRDRAIETTLRVLLSCRLPMLGGLPLHAAGIGMGSVGTAFYGVSGAGKSTLSSHAPFPVLSDEAIVTIPHDGRWEVSSSGFWGSLDLPLAPSGYFPLAGLFELHKEADTRIERLSARQAFVSLLSVITVPDSPLLWSAAVQALGRLVEAVPVFSLGWAPARPPWDAIREALAGASAP
jgi:hypothetical protein